LTHSCVTLDNNAKNRRKKKRIKEIKTDFSLEMVSFFNSFFTFDDFACWETVVAWFQDAMMRSRERKTKKIKNQKTKIKNQNQKSV
jgi:hypothetical protein